MSIPPDTLLDTLLLANHLTPVKSPLQEPQRDLPPHSDSAIDLFIDEQNWPPCWKKPSAMRPK
jgi:hypothetical protein